MELVSMKKEEKKEKEESSECRSICDDSKYPYGLCLNLDTETLKKLGIKDLPETGGEFKIIAKAVVKSTHQSESLEGNTYKSLELQITDMAVKYEDTRADEEIMYGNGKGK